MWGATGLTRLSIAIDDQLTTSMPVYTVREIVGMQA